MPRKENKPYEKGYVRLVSFGRSFAVTTPLDYVLSCWINLGILISSFQHLRSRFLPHEKYIRFPPHLLLAALNILAEDEVSVVPSFVLLRPICLQPSVRVEATAGPSASSQTRCVSNTWRLPLLLDLGQEETMPFLSSVDSRRARPRDVSRLGEACFWGCLDDLEVPVKREW